MLLEFQEEIIMVKRVVEFCAERGLCVGNTYFEQRSLQKYTRVARDQERVEVKRMIGLLLVKNMLHYEQNEGAVRGMGQGLQTTILY